MKRFALGEICEIQLGKMLSPKAKLGASPLPYLRNANVQWNRVDLTTISRMDFDEREQRKYLLKKGDVLVCEGGEPGRAAVWKDELAPCFFQKALHRLRPLTDSVLPEYIVYALRKAALRGEFTNSITQATIAHLPVVALEKLELPLPPLSEQREIVARLDAQLAAAARARVAVAAQLAEAERFAKILADAEYPVGRWPMVAVRDLAIVAGGIQKTPDRAPNEFHRPFLTVRNVQRGALNLSVVERFEVSPAELERNRLEAGDLLIVEGNGSREHIGRNALFPEGLPEEWIHQNHIIRVRFGRTKVEPRFASHFFNSTAGREQMLERAATTTGLYTLSTAKVAALELPVPPIQEQQLIADRIEEAQVHVAALRTHLMAQLAELDRLPAVLLRTAFAG